MENRTFNTILYCMDHGEDALKEKLMSLSIEDLKNTFRYLRFASCALIISHSVKDTSLNRILTPYKQNMNYKK